MEIDELKVYRGGDIVIDKHITIFQPTLEEIIEFGESKYYAMVTTVCATPSDYMWQLEEVGIDFTKVNEYQLFSEMLAPSLSKENTQIVFGDLDFQMYELRYHEELKEPVLYNPETTSMISKMTYQTIVAYLRAIHGFKKNVVKARNEETRQILIEDAKEEYEDRQNEKRSSVLKNQISSLINSGNSTETFHTVWKLPINAFVDSFKRVLKEKQANLLLQSGYSGFGIDLKKTNKNELNWTGSLES